MTFWLSLPVHSGSLKRIDYPKQSCLFLLNVFTALKGTHFYILLDGQKLDLVSSSFLVQEILE